MTQDFAKRPSRAAKSGAQTDSKKQNTHTRPNKPERKPAVKRKGNTRKPASKLKKSTSKKPPIWAWILIGLAVAGFALFLSNIADKQAPQDSATETVETTAHTKEPEESQVRFDFYEILQEHEIQVEDRVVEATPKADNIIYYLQAASFKNKADADSLRARLILLGLPAKIETSTNSKQQEWHRIIAGPFDTRSKLAKARSVLASNKMNSLVLKRKQ